MCLDKILFGHYIGYLRSDLKGKRGSIGYLHAPFVLCLFMILCYFSFRFLG